MTHPVRELFTKPVGEHPDQQVEGDQPAGIHLAGQMLAARQRARQRPGEAIVHTVLTPITPLPTMESIARSRASSVANNRWPVPIQGSPRR